MIEAETLWPNRNAADGKLWRALRLRNGQWRRALIWMGLGTVYKPMRRVLAAGDDKARHPCTP